MKIQTPSSITLGLVLVIYILSHQVYQFLFLPESNTPLYNSALLGQIFYLPFGVAIIVTWLHGRSAVFYLLISGLVNEYLISSIPLNYIHILSILNVAVVPYLVMEFFKACGLDVYQMPGVEFNKMWRTIILVTFACSAFASFINAYLGSLEEVSKSPINSVVQGIIGGVSGTFLGLLIIYAVFLLFNFYLQRKAAK